jgi:hypothetical protein
MSMVDFQIYPYAHLSLIHNQPKTGAVSGLQASQIHPAGMPLKIGERRIDPIKYLHVLNRTIQSIDPQTIQEGEK